jgi:uncharacterized glyoxalase superfamily protein PhnB
MSTRTLFHSLQFTDVDAAIGFLTAVGFTERIVVRDQADPAVVHHAEFAWRETGGLMFGSAGRPDRGGLADEAGHGSCYCVVETDPDVDRVHDAALGAGGRSIQAPQANDYGGRGCTVQDAEGNQWSFGTYPGE